MLTTDVIVVGAGPVGLFQAFELGLLGLRVDVIDVLPQAGGQCMALYPDKPIYDVPGLPRCTGRELTQRLLEQAAPFLGPQSPTGAYPHLHLGHLVEGLSADEGGWLLRGSSGLHIRAQGISLACGVGAFLPRSLSLAGLEHASNVHHHASWPDGTPASSADGRWQGQHVVIYGGEDEAVLAACELAEQPWPDRPARITLLFRRAALQAHEALLSRLQSLLEQGRITFEVGMPQAAVRDDTEVAALELLGPDGAHRRLDLDQLLIQLGLSPKLGPLQNWGLAMSKKQLSVRPDSFETNLPGVFAVGDLNHYEGKKRLLVCGFHEATLAAHTLAARLRPHDAGPLLYTTTSSVLHERLGVQPRTTE